MMVAPERWDSPLMFEDVFEKPILHHGWTHNQNNKQVLSDLEKLDHFYMRQFSKICQKLDAIQEGDGTLLDNMMFTYLWVSMAKVMGCPVKQLGDSTGLLKGFLV